MLRSILAVLAAPLVYGALSVPLNQLVLKLFPRHVDGDTTRHPGILALLLVLSGGYNIASGYTVGWIASHHPYYHLYPAIALNLAIGILVTVQYWNKIPVWYHVSFLLSLPLFMALGLWLRVR